MKWRNSTMTNTFKPTEYGCLTTLYKRDSKGKIRKWTVCYGWDEEGRAGIQTESGIWNGKLVLSEWKMCEQKNVGRSNETSTREQALAEAESLFMQKVEKGMYFTDINSVDSSEQFSPMLAHDYNKYPLTSGFSQPKLDGIRCIAKKDGLWTRNGKPITSCPHIWDALKDFFLINPNIVLDGELYNHSLKDDFNKITSLVRKTKPKPEDIKECAELVQYHVYDYFDKDEPNLPFNNVGLDDENYTLGRAANMQWLLNDTDLGRGVIVLVDTVGFASQEDLDYLYGVYLQEGYEGQMVRAMDIPYQGKRSKGLVKRKEFITEEFRVVGVEEGVGNWSGCVKRFKLALPDGTEFGSGVRGSQAEMKALLESGITPDWATCRYFELTPDGIPRFPIVIDYGTGQRED